MTRHGVRRGTYEGRDGVERTKGPFEERAEPAWRDLDPQRHGDAHDEPHEVEDDQERVQDEGRVPNRCK